MNSQLNKLVANRHYLREAIKTVLTQYDITYKQAWSIRDDYMGLAKAEHPKDVLKFQLWKMMDSLNDVNRLIQSELKLPSQSGVILDIHKDRICTLALPELDKLHSHYGFEVGIGPDVDVTNNSKNSRWHKSIYVTLKLTWNSKVLKNGVSPIVAWRAKPTFVLDATKVDISERTDLDPSIEVFKVKTLQVYRDNTTSSYNPDPRYQIEDAYYSHIRGTDGKCIEPAISTTEGWAIRVANQRTSKNILKSFL